LFCYSFLYKNFATSAIITEDVEPTLSELKTFLELKNTQVEVDLNRTSRTGVFGKENQATRHSVSNRNNVAVCEGKSTNLQESLVSINENMMMPMSKHKELNKTMRKCSKLLSTKYFQQINICQSQIEKMTVTDVKKNSDKNDLYITNEAVFNNNKSEREDLKVSQGEKAQCVKRGHLRSDIRDRHRLSEERLIKNNCTYYIVDISNKEQSSAVPSGNSQQAMLKDGDDEEKQEASNEKRIVLRLRRRKSRLSLLNDAESPIFDKPKQDNSSEHINDDAQSSVLPRNTNNSEIGNIANSSILSSSILSSIDSSLVKQEIIEEDSVHLSRIRKKRCMQAEAFIKDNTETSGTRLWYQAPLSDIRNTAVNDSELATKKSSQKLTEEYKPQTDNDIAQKKIHSSNLSAKIEGIKFSFEMISKFEPWYQTFQRQDMNAEFQDPFSMYDAKKPFLLPYEMENFHETLPQKNSQCHMFKAHEREQQESLNLGMIEEEYPLRSSMDTSKLEGRDPISNMDEELKKITEEMKEIQSIEDMEDMENMEDGINIRELTNNSDLFHKLINEICEEQSECTKQHELDKSKELEEVCTIGIENNSLCANLEDGQVKTMRQHKHKRKINKTGWPKKKRWTRRRKRKRNKKDT
jgi:hypothetical protein